VEQHSIRYSLRSPVAEVTIACSTATPQARHNEALKLSRRFAPRSLTPVRYASVTNER
jgi:hypothetical protein